MKLDGLDYLNLSSHLDNNECMVQQSTREFVDKEIIPIIDDHFEKGGCIDQKTKQPSTVLGIQIRAPSLYYPITISAIKIPEWTHPVFDRLLDENDEGRFTTLIRESRKNNLELLIFINNQECLLS